MKLFTVGPVMMHKEIIDAGGRQIEYFRTEKFSKLIIEIDKMLKKLLDSNNDNILLSSSGTGAMEAAVINLFSKNDKIIIVNGGTFGRRFVEICKSNKLQYKEIKLDFGESLTKKHLTKFRNKGFTGFLMNHHETSTGTLYDLNLVSSFCKEQNILLVVDAITSLISDLISLKGLKVDIMIASSHKALALSPGLSILSLSDNAKNIIKKTNNPGYYFNLAVAIQNFSRGQTPFTPSISVIYQLHKRLSILFEGEGFLREKNNIVNNALYFRDKIKTLPIYIPHNNLSNCLTPIMFKNKNVDAYIIFQKLKNDYDIVVNPCGGILSKKMLRIGHIGNIKKNDFDDLISALKDLERSNEI